MSIGKAISALRTWLAEHEEDAALREFTCGHCERSDRCGREPSATCIDKHQQIARGDDWRYRPGAGRLYPYQ